MEIPRNAAELVLDGKLLGENVEEVNLAELLQVAFDEFDQSATLAEEELEHQWPALCARLADAWAKTRFVGLVNGGIRRLLGHARISTTEIYTYVSAQKLSEVHRKFHPRCWH